MKAKKIKSIKKLKKKRLSTKKKTIDAFPERATNRTKNKRGRPRTLPWATVTGRASNYEVQLGEVWKKLQAPLLRAQTADQVTAAFEEFASPYEGEFVPRLSSDILCLLSDPDFPQKAKPQIRFLARSLAGRPTLSFRTSRDTCEREANQQKLKSPHRILRREFYIECSCGYQGPALDNDCPQCGAQPQLSIDVWTGRAPPIPSDGKKRKVPKATPPKSEPEVAVSNSAKSNNVQCECGAIVAAASREKALEGLAEHKRLVHGHDQEQKEK